MLKYLTIAEAQEQLPALPDELADEPAIITKDGKPAIGSPELVEGSL